MGSCLWGLWDALILCIQFEFILNIVTSLLSFLHFIFFKFALVIVSNFSFLYWFWVWWKPNILICCCSQYWATLPMTWATGVLCNQDKSGWFQRNAWTQAQVAQIAPKSEEERGHIADSNLKPRFEQVSVDPPAMKNDQKKHQERMNGNESWRSCRHESPGSPRSPRTAEAHSSLQDCWLLPCQSLGEHSQGCPWAASNKRFCPKPWG